MVFLSRFPLVSFFFPSDTFGYFDKIDATFCPSTFFAGWMFTSYWSFPRLLLFGGARRKSFFFPTFLFSLGNAHAGRKQMRFGLVPSLAFFRRGFFRSSLLHGWSSVDDMEPRPFFRPKRAGTFPPLPFFSHPRRFGGLTFPIPTFLVRRFFFCISARSFLSRCPKKIPLVPFRSL